MSTVKAIEQIERAGLTDKQYRAARRLLDRVVYSGAVDSGHLKLTKDAAADVCTTTSEGSLRRLLGQLKRAEIISYRINGYVYVDFKSWGSMDCPRADSDHGRANSDHPRAESDHPRANSDHGNEAVAYYTRSESDHGRAESDHPRAESDHPRAESDQSGQRTYTHAHAGVGRLVGTTPSLDESIPTYLPKPEESALSLRLLLHIRMMKRNADRLSQSHPFERIREAVAHWWENRGELFGEQPGIIVRWLDNWDESGVPPISPEFRRSALYRQFRPSSEIESEAAREAELLARQAEPSAGEADPSEEQEAPKGALELLWDEICEGIAMATPDIYHDWLQGSRLSVLDVEQAVIVVGKNKQGWVKSRLGKQLRRELAMRGHQPEKMVIQEVDDD